MPSIGYKNLFDSGVVSVDSEDPAYVKANAYDGLIYPGDVWKPATAGTHYITVDAGVAVNVDYWACMGHDVDSIKLQYSSDNFAADINDVSAAVVPVADEPLYKQFVAISARYWRFEVIKAAGPSSVACVSLGERLDIPESVQVGFKPYSLTGGDEYLNNASDGGYPLGRSLIRKGGAFSLDFSLLSPAFVRNSWDPFAQHAMKRPFFFVWDYDVYPDDVAFCWTDRRIDVPSYHMPNFMRVRLNVKART